MTRQHAAPSLSEFWRYDRSAHRPAELRSVLEGAETLLGNMGSSFRVTWSGAGVTFTDLQRRIVALDYGPLKDQPCPFPGPVVDEVIGYAAHEGGHCLWTPAGKDKALKTALYSRWRALPHILQADWMAGEERVLGEVCRIHNILEDAFIDRKIAAQWPVLGRYIAFARQQLLARSPVDLAAVAAAARPDRNAAINLWAALALYGIPLPPASSQVSQAMEALEQVTERVTREEDASHRHGLAIEAAAVLWAAFPIQWTPPPARSRDPGAADGAGQPDAPVGAENLDEFDPPASAKQRGRKVQPLPVGAMDEAPSKDAPSAEDLSSPVAETLAEDPGQVAAVVRTARYSPEMARAAAAPVQADVHAIREAFRRCRLDNQRWLGGQTRGRMDDRSLWKPYAGSPTFFRRRELPGSPSLAVGLLLDVSGSMARHMAIVHQAAALFAGGLSGLGGISFAAWGYTGHASRVSLTRIWDQGLPGLSLEGVECGKETPSGAAIAAAALLMGRMKGKRRALIHFTDGKPDRPQHVARSVAACSRAGIQVYAIALGQDRGALAAQYGDESFQVIQSVPELPRAVARLLQGLGSAMETASPASSDR